MDMVFSPVIFLLLATVFLLVTRVSQLMQGRETGQPKPFGSLPNMGFDYELATNGALVG
jgi:hypothetical protein